MRCPHCKKEFDEKAIAEMKEEEIFTEITEATHSISSLSRKLKIKRSTLVYYLDNLIKKGKIVTERLENLTGRPTILSVRIEGESK